MKPKYTRLFRRFLAFLLAVLLSTTVAFAGNAIGGTEGKNGAFKEFERLLDGSYFLKRDNYSLDMVETGITDMMPTMGNFVANVLFGMIKLTVEVTCTVYFLCTELNVVEMFQDDINNVQSKLKDGIFDGVYLLAFSFFALYLLILFFKQNTPAILSQAVQFLTILVITSFMFSNTTSVIIFIDDFVKEINNVVTSAIYLGDNSGGSNEAKTVDSMWDIMLHKPWETLEFIGGKEDYTKYVDKILSSKPNSEDRLRIVMEIADEKKDPKFFSKANPGSQIPLLIVYLIPCIVRCLIYIVFGVMQLGFRLVTILLAYMGILIMTLSLFPQLGGARLIMKWCNKIIQINLNIVMINFLLAFALMVSSKLYSSVANGWGWLLAILIDSLLTLGIFLFRDKLMKLLKVANKTFSSKQSIERKAGSAVDNIDRTAKNAVSSAIEAVGLSDITAKDLGIAKQRAKKPTVLRPDEILFEDNIQHASAYAHEASAPKEDIIIERPQLYSTKPKMDSPISEASYHRELSRPMLIDTSAKMQHHRTPVYADVDISKEQSSTSKNAEDMTYSSLDAYTPLPEDSDRFYTTERPQLEEKPTSSHIRFTDEQPLSTAELTDTVNMTVPVIDEVAANTQHLDAPEPNRSVQSLVTDHEAIPRLALDTPIKQEIPTAVPKPTNSTPTQIEAPTLADIPQQQADKTPIQLSDRSEGNIMTEQPRIPVRPRLEVVEKEPTQTTNDVQAEQHSKSIQPSFRTAAKVVQPKEPYTLGDTLSAEPDASKPTDSIQLTSLT